jgi:hypothetical protein
MQMAPFLLQAKLFMSLATTSADITISTTSEMEPSNVMPMALRCSLVIAARMFNVQMNIVALNTWTLITKYPHAATAPHLLHQCAMQLSMPNTIASLMITVSSIPFTLAAHQAAQMTASRPQTWDQVSFLPSAPVVDWSAPWR